MKKTLVRILALAFIAAMMLGAMSSCAKKISGSYEGELELFGQGWRVTYTFSGSKVEAVSKFTLLGQVTTKETEGTYEITENSDGTMEITFDFEEETDLFKDGTYTFTEAEDHVKIGGIKYEKLGE